MKRHARILIILITIALILLVFSLPAQGMESSINQIASPTARATATATAAVTSVPSVVAPFESEDPTYLIMRPRSGNINHDADNTLVEVAQAPVFVADFVAVARFFNPYSTTEGSWDYGFVFRKQTFDLYDLIVRSDGSWRLSYFVHNSLVSTENGIVSNLDISEGGSNVLRLVVIADQAYFYANDEEVAILDVSANQLLGNISVITGFYSNDEITGAVTRYEDFTVWSIGLIPTFTPTALPETGFIALSGVNLGEIEIGQGQLWTYEGEAGEIVNIAVHADTPYVEQGVIFPEGLDTLLIVRAPDGSVILNSDDVATGNTNSGYTNLVLPMDGVYELEVRSWSDASSGGYTLIIDPSDVLLATPTMTPRP